MFAKQVPQQTVPLELKESVPDMIKKLADRNQAIADSIAEGRDEQPEKPKNTLASQILMKMLGGG
ncbi:hypothetical protein [Limosilactobacillus reuteri]|uniref:hypothetical protein n=1 Tax=Limosilactobacillus reuteri TaxID=1598 RepID=UPI001CDABA72|nr:hypothetical protein [Limosilactobacillus reuteri]